jgi:hypothetical protein
MEINKQLSREILSGAMELHQERHSPPLSEAQALLFFAVASLRRAENTGDADPDLQKALKRGRKLLQELLPHGEENQSVEDKGLDLGQYAHTKVFDGNAKKAEKFARLMGGAAASDGQPHHHSTFAPDSSTVAKITHDIEEQFNAAITHRGKKGLGS